MIASVFVAAVLQLTAPAQAWGFVASPGRRAGLFGKQSGSADAYVYPLKILSGLHLTFRVYDEAFSAERYARATIARPESTTIVYTGPFTSFEVRETLFTPVHEQGAIVRLEVKTPHYFDVPVQIDASFTPEMQIAASDEVRKYDAQWDSTLHAFEFADQSKPWVAYVGSPDAEQGAPESTDSRTLRFTAPPGSSQTKTIVIAASLQGRSDAEREYNFLARSYESLLTDAQSHYRALLANTVSIDVPDKQIEHAYKWSRISLAQATIDHPVMGAGLVAGYPAYISFFGRDTEWSMFALDAMGDFADARSAIDMIGKHQRADGKIPHDVWLGLPFRNWLRPHSDAFDAADATPLYIIAVNDYVTQSGDVAYAKQNWNTIWKTYEFLRSTYDSLGLPKNAGVGTGWLEGAIPVETELYQSAAGDEALRALAHLAKVSGHGTLSAGLLLDAQTMQRHINETFWSPQKKIFAYALDLNQRRIDRAYVLAAVPMWFRMLDDAKAQAMIDTLTQPDFLTDWGTRVISDRSDNFDPESGQSRDGSVWPLFTGWASVAEYRYGRTFSAYENLRANALLALDGGSLGHVVEQLPSERFEPGGVPQQTWSAAMAIGPILLGMLGLDSDSEAKTLTFAPQLPANWGFANVREVRVGDDTADLRYHRSADLITLDVSAHGAAPFALHFAPALSPRAEVLGVTVDGRRASFTTSSRGDVRHLNVSFAVRRISRVQIRLRHDFAISYDSQLPPLEASSTGLRLLHQRWSPSHARLTLQFAGAAGNVYLIDVLNAAEIASVSGARLEQNTAHSVLKLWFPEGSDSYSVKTVTVRFRGR